MDNAPTGLSSRDTRPRTAAIVAAVGLLMMAVIAAAANFGVLGNLIVPGNPATTSANLIESAGRFRLAASGLLIVAILDVVVAWGLYVVLRGVNPSLSLLGASFRVVYAAIFGVMINHLFSALRTAPLDPAETLFLIESFDHGWQLGLAVFGTHLCIVGVLLWRPGVFSRIVAVLLIIAGAGYFIDGIGTALSPTYALELSMYTFIGEVVFIVWLLVRGGKTRDTGAQ